MAEEWRRLQELYAGMSDEELEAVADQGYDLTDIAKQALNAEISRRHIKLTVRLARPKQEEAPQVKGTAQFNPADLDLKTVEVVENREEAEWVRVTLNQAGIICLFNPGFREEPEELEFSRYADFGVMVLDTDFERARHAIRGFDEYFGKEEEEDPEFVVRCPKCSSTDVVLQGLDSDGEEGETAEREEETEKPSREQSGTSILEAKYNWSCDACGYLWEDDGMETPI